MLASWPLNDGHVVTLPGAVSNPRLPVNGRMSYRSTTWHRCTATGSRTPLSEMRAGILTSGPSRQVMYITGAGRLEHPKASRPLPVFGTGSSSSRVTPMTRALGGRRTHGLVPTKDALYLAELQGHGLAGTTRTCDPRLRRAVLLILLSCGEMVSTAGVEPAPSGFVDRRPDPLGHVDKCSPTDRMGGCAADGSCTRDLRLDRPALRLAELRRQMVRALGLEPSLIRGKGPVPYQSGVTRIGGPGGNRTPYVGRRLVYSQLRPMARPTPIWGQMALAP